MKKLKNKSDIFDAIILLVLSLIIIIRSIALNNGRSWILSPALFPLIVSIFMFVLSLILLIGGFKTIKKEKDLKVNYKFIILFVVISYIYIYLLGKFHFIFLSTVYLYVLMSILGEEKIGKKAIISTTTSTLIFLIFTNFLNVLLP